jgi:hypothetical protein
MVLNWLFGKSDSGTTTDQQYINDGSNSGRWVEGNLLDKNNISIYGPHKGMMYDPGNNFYFTDDNANPLWEQWRRDQQEVNDIMNQDQTYTPKNDRIQPADLENVTDDGIYVPDLPNEKDVSHLYGERFDGDLEVMNQRGFRHRQNKTTPEEPPFMIGDWLPNTLNDMDNATYHFTLYIDNKQFVNRGLYENQGVIIAETGSTTYFHIDNVEIASPTGGSHAVTNLAPEITFTLTEPNGAAFFPKLMAICEAKGIDAVAEAGYALELRFKGRDKITGDPKMSKQTWVYNLAVTDVQTKHGIDGSTYNFRSVHLANTAAKASWNNPNETITVTQCSTLGEAMKGLEEQLNKYHNRKALQSSSKPDTVKIEFDEGTEGWASWKMLPPTGSSTNTNKPEKSDWTLDAGSSVKDFMTKLILHTKEMEDRLDTAGVDIKIDTREKLDHVKDFYIKYFKIKTSVEIGMLWNNAQKKFNEDCTYSICPFNEPPPEKQARYEQIADSVKIQKQKLARIKELNLMTKRYDYLHTGLNTEVLQFDATLDMAFFQPEVAYGGRTSYNVKAKEADIPEDPSDIPDPSSEAAILGRLQKQINDQLKIRTEAGQKEQELLARRDTIMEGLNRRLESGESGMQIPIDVLKLETEAKKQRAIRLEADALLDQLSDQKADRLSQSYADSIGIGDSTERQYLGDIQGYKANNVTRKYLPTFAKRVNQSNNSSLREVAKQNLENTGGDMLNIEIGIRGDPYWLGPPSSKTGYTSTGSNSFEINDTELVDYDIGPPIFLFNMSFPDPEHGSKPYFNKLYAGVYKTMTVIHQFRAGQFTQFLTGVRDTSITTTNVMMLVAALKPTLVGKGEAVKPSSETGDEGLNDVAGDGATVAPAGEVPATVSGREQQVMDRLINEHGLTPAQAAGIVGNLNKESALRTGARNPGDGNDGSDSIGIAQWNSTRADNLKAFAANRGVSHLDLNTQADFIMHELKGSGAYGGGSESGAWNRLKNATNEQAAAEAFTYYERFKDYNVAGNHETKSRKSQSSRILNEYYNKAQENNIGLG